MRCRISRLFIVTMSSIWLVFTAGRARAEPVVADWTVMVFMNGKNNLQYHLDENFLDMARVGSDAKLKIVVQMGRKSSFGKDRDVNWGGVQRFLVKKDMAPLMSNAEPDAKTDLARNPKLSDMGSPEALANFIAWTKSKYPAKRYMLVIWNHGQGWRRSANMQGSAADTPADGESASGCRGAGGFRSVSSDDETGHTLYNSQIATVLHDQFRRDELAVLGFDACLMGMIETAYAFRDTADTMVGSEEVVPGPGWAYEPWLQKLDQNPAMSAAALAAAVVDAYGDKDRGDTLSAIDEKQIVPLARSLGDLSERLDRSLASSSTVDQFLITELRATRQDKDGYCYTEVDRRCVRRYSVDLYAILQSYSKAIDTYNRKMTTVDRANYDRVRFLISKTKSAFSKALIKNFARTTADGQPVFDSHGLAIYFPKTMNDFKADTDYAGYLTGNKDHAVEFVRSNRWPPFMLRFLDVTQTRPF